MPAIDDLDAVRRVLEVQGPRDDVVAAGQHRLNELFLRDAAGRQRRTRAWGGAAVACALAAAAVVVAVVIVPVGGSGAHPGAVGPGADATGKHRPPAASVQQAILTAVGAVSDDIMYISVTNAGMPADMGRTVQYWLWPARAPAGRPVHLVMAAGGLRTEMTFTQAGRFPPPVARTTLTVDTAARTWTTRAGVPVPGIPLESSLYLLDRRFMLDNFVNTSQVVSRHAAIDGQPAIEVSYPGANGLLHFLLWVNAQTYLPLRMDKLHFMNQYPDSLQRHDFQFLPPTRANLARIAVTVPPGYRHVAELPRRARRVTSPAGPVRNGYVPNQWRCQVAELPPPEEIVLAHFIVSADVERSRRFYTEVLGGRVVFSGEPTYVALSNSWIIINVGGGPTDDKPSVTLETPGDPNRVSSFLNIRVKDIEAVYAHWSARGADFLTPPKRHQYEIRCYLRDPDGHLIEVGQTINRAGDWSPAHWPSITGSGDSAGH